MEGLKSCDEISRAFVSTEVLLLLFFHVTSVVVVVAVVVVILPTRLIADTSKPFRVSFSHFPFVCALLAGFSIGEPGASPSRKR